MRERRKLTFLLLAWLTLFRALPAAAQTGDVRLSMTFRNEKLPEVFVRLEKSSSYKFLFTYDDVEKYTVNGSVKDARFFDIVKYVLRGKPLEYTVSGKFINISVKRGSHQKTAKNGMQTYGGYVFEERTGDPVIGAHVKLLGTNIVTVTGIDGSFSFDYLIAGTHQVQVSYMGMKTTTQTLSRDMKILLKEDSKVLDDVVVTGMFKKAKQSYTGAVSTISSDELKTYRGQNLLQTLKNIDASINFQTNNLIGSNPNNLPSINIRGNSSVPTDLKEFNETQKNTVNTPLIIMDGFEISLEKLMDYNDDEIASINILKDASATAIYGSRGANGVIVVVSKEPEAGKLRVNAEAGLSIEVPDLSSYDLLNASEKLALEKSVGIYDLFTPSLQISADEMYNRRLKSVLAGVNTDWMAKPLQNGIGQRYNLRLEGGSKEFRWSASASLNNIEGAMKGSSRRTFNGGITLMYSVKDFTFRNYTNIAVNNSKESPYGTFSNYVNRNPYESPYDENGNLIRSYYWMNSTQPYAGNPLYDASLNSFDKSGYKETTDNFSVEWTPFAGFIARGQVGITGTTNTSDKFVSPFDSRYDNDTYNTGNNIFRKGQYTYGSGDSYTVNANVTLSYARTFDNVHQVYLGADWSLAQSRSKMYYFDLEGFATDDITDLSTAQQYAENGKPTGTNTFYRRVGLTGNANYTYANRYYVDASYRVDGNSNFGSNKKWAPFWSLGIGWNLHNEKLFKSLSDKVNTLRLRLSYGETGTQLSSSTGALSLYKYITDNRYLNWMGVQLQNLGNPNLTWQKTDEFNLGFEFGLFQNRIKGQFDYYTKKTSNLLSYMDLPLSMGFSSYTANVGAVKNSGFETMLQGYVLRDTNKHLFWILTGQLVYNKNRITELSADIEAQNQAYLAEGVEVANLMQVGRPQNAIYGVRSLGIDPSTGNEVFLDKDGNITSTWNAKNVVYLGQKDPEYRGILSSMFNYKGWSLNVSFAFHWGGQIYNSTLRDRVEVTKDVIRYNNVDRRVLSSRWMKPGDITFFQKIQDTEATKATSRFVMDDNVLELQNISLQYKWEGRSLQRLLPLQSVIFAINANDLFYWSSVRMERGTDYPFARNIQASMKIMF